MNRNQDYPLQFRGIGTPRGSSLTKNTTDSKPRLSAIWPRKRKKSLMLPRAGAVRCGTGITGHHRGREGDALCPGASGAGCAGAWWSSRRDGTRRGLSLDRARPGHRAAGALSLPFPTGRDGPPPYLPGDFRGGPPSRMTRRLFATAIRQPAAHGFHLKADPTTGRRLVRLQM